MPKHNPKAAEIIKRPRNDAPLTTTQRLGALIKSAREIMRKDKGLNGDLDRLPLLTWILFLKFLDDMESMREEEAKLSGERFRPAIAVPYRWRDWAAKPDGITGDTLLKFINEERTTRHDGTKGAGLFAYLRNLQGTSGGDRRDVVATVFRGVDNRMKSGYLLRDVLNKVNEIHFNSSEEIHTLGHLYESMLREMRDAAGDSGEFYTPRPVVRFMVTVTDPQLGEAVLDPACGTGGFLVETFLHLQPKAVTVEQQKILQRRTILGIEPKSLPYLLAQMNLLLHGVESPNIDPMNALRFPLKDIGEKDRVDVILTNPPFGGAEEKGILSNFPEGMQSSETALLFLQLIMRKLRRSGSARAAVVLPDGVLSQEGIATRVRQELTTQYNLHTVVRLPRGVFEPYTKSSTSILFFDTNPPTKYVWFFDVGMRSGVKAYTQNQPLVFDDLKGCVDWWKKRVESDKAWKVERSEFLSLEYALTLPNPRATAIKRYPEPQALTAETQSGLSQLQSVISSINNTWEALIGKYSNQWPREKFGAIAKQVKREIVTEPEKEYPILAMAWYAKGLYVKHVKKGSEIRAAKLYQVRTGDFVYNRLFAWKGSFAEVTTDSNEAYVSNEFPCFEVDKSKVASAYLWAYFSQPGLWEYIEGLSTGTTSTSRLRLKEQKLKQFWIPIPPKSVQEQIATSCNMSRGLGEHLEGLSKKFGQIGPSILERLISPLSNK